MVFFLFRRQSLKNIHISLDQIRVVTSYIVINRFVAVRWRSRNLSKDSSVLKSEIRNRVNIARSFFKLLGVAPFSISEL